jgi:hypothetical protein
MLNKKQKTTVWLWVLVALCVLALIGMTVMMLLWKPDKQTATNFQECKDASGAIMESYPEQCMIDGKSFTNSTQTQPKPDPDPTPEPDTTKDGKYVGLSERAALDKAETAGKNARIVERDGVYLPVDASFQPGRLNFHVKNGKVYLVHVEGEEN